MASSSRSIVAIIGPTGIGKTKLSIAIAKAIDGEVVSVDSLQVYRDGKILTAQVTDEETMGVRHHMIDYLEAHEEPSDYIREALSSIRDILSRGKRAVLCGGSTSLTEPLLFHPSVKQHQPLVMTLYTKMDVLGNLTDSRIESMIRDGLLHEVEQLRSLEAATEPLEDKPRGVWKAIGYEEIASSIDGGNRSNGDARLDDGINKMKVATRQYAYSQLNWIWTSILPKLFRHGLECILFRVESAATFKQEVEEKAVDQCHRWLRT